MEGLKLNKKNIYLMYLIIFLQSLVFYGSIATLYRQKRGLSMTEIFIIESAYFIIVIILEVPWGKLADKIGYKKIVVIANFIYFLSKIVFYNSGSFLGFLIERIFLAAALAGLSGCDSAYLYNSIYDKSLCDKVFSKYNFYTTLGFLLASLSSVFIIEISMESTVLFTIVAYGIAFILSLFLDEVPKDEKNASIKMNFKETFNNKNIIVFIISITLFSEIVQGITVYLNQNKYISCGIDVKKFGIILALSQIISLITGKSYYFKRILGERKYINILYLIILVATLILWRTTSAVVSVISVMSISLSDALFAPIVMEIENKSVTTGDRATVLSIYSVIGSVVSAVINPLIGLGADYSLRTSFLLCSMLCVIAFIAMNCYLVKEDSKMKLCNEKRI